MIELWAPQGKRGLLRAITHPLKPTTFPQITACWLLFCWDVWLAHVEYICCFVMYLAVPFLSSNKRKKREEKKEKKS